MRVLHTSDWHLGRTLFSVPLIEHQRVFLDWLVEQVDQHKIDAVLISGDVYDRSVPSVEVIAMFEKALIELARRTTVVIIPGNHDSATRLGFAGPLLESANVHVRASASDLERPIVMSEGQQSVQIFGIPYLEPTFHAENFECERTHAAVLGAAMERIRTAAISDVPMIVVAHAFVTGGAESESERDVRVGGIPDAPISVFDGAHYVALGHLHRPQKLTTTKPMTARYSGSPIAYSFSEEGQEKSVVLLDINQDGIDVTLLPTPQVRSLTTIRGELTELLSSDEYTSAEDHWVRAILTDERRPERPMERLRERFAHTLHIEFAPVTGLDVQDNRAVDISTLDPIDVTTSFIEYVSGTQASEREEALIAQAVERVRISEAQ